MPNFFKVSSIILGIFEYKSNHVFPAVQALASINIPFSPNCATNIVGAGSARTYHCASNSFINASITLFTSVS